MTSDDKTEEYTNRIADLQQKYAEREIEHVETRIQELEKLTFSSLDNLERTMTSQFQSQQKAVEVANQAMQARLAGVNEFRAAMGDQIATYIPRSTAEAKFKEQERRITSLERSLSEFNGRLIGYTAGMGAVVLIISIVSQLLNLGG